MPRNPAVKKGHHNNRHENGLVGPGKRVPKQKSNSQLNGIARPPATPEEPLPTSPIGTCAEQQASAASTGIDLDSAFDAAAASEELRWRKRDSESSSDGNEQKWDAVNGSVQNMAPKRPDAPTKHKSAQDLSSLQIASTILASNPAGDTISLLIVLLALPSMVLTMVQVLFASLTLVPPSGSISPASFLSLFDVFQGSVGSPSLLTMGVVDVICFAAWMCLWTWAQNFALDLAQIQIALTLGSGNAGKNGNVGTICVVLVLFLHAVRSGDLRHFLLTKLYPASVLSHPRVAPYARFLPSNSDFGFTLGPPSKVKSLFAVHIISQALMAFVRRRLAGTSSVNKTQQLKSELPTNITQTLDSSSQDLVFNAASSPGQDVSLQAPPVRESNQKALTAKKRRRQANQVRSRQPFWAALASTKVHVLREVEHNKDKAQVGNGSNGSLADSDESVYITNVEPSTIQFEAASCAFLDEDLDHKADSNYTPFYVRINNARWHSVSLEPVLDHTGMPSKWCGSIGGLAPDCNYICSFRYVDGDDEIASVLVRTPPLADRDQQNTVVSAPVRQSARPNSPTTTLKTSIHTAERSREDANKRRNQARKAHRNALTKLDKEIEGLQVKVKASNDDNKQKQKLRQAEAMARQHEEAVSAFNVRLDELETIPEEETSEYDNRKAAYESRTRQLSEANASLSSAKAETNSELAAIKSELTTTNTRKERLVARNAKLAAEQERLAQANIQNLSEKERKELESATRSTEQERQLDDWRRRINDMNIQLSNVRAQTQAVFHEIDEAMAKSSLGPLTPEGEIPGTIPRSFTYNHMQPSTFVPDPQASPFEFAKMLPRAVARPRSGTNQSTGGLSAGSADFDDYDPIPPSQRSNDFDVGIAVNGRKNSGSSRGNNNHSPAAGVIGSALRSSQQGSSSPGHMQSTNTW